MPRVHNKKRNVGIIYEQIINFICSKLIEEDKHSAEIATNIIKNHFNSKSQLFKEYKLFKALATTSNISDQLAYSIINEAKKACNHMFDSQALEKEKSLLIRELNYKLGKGKIFEEKVANYRTYATIQTLLNEWRSNSNNFDKRAEYEIKLHQKLTEDSNVISEQVKPVKVDNLTYKLMQQMFDKKYSNLLNNGQKKLIESFINDDEESLKEHFSELKSECINSLKNYMSSCSNKILLEKKNNILNNISLLNENDTSKTNLQRFLTVEKLREELSGEE